jgi:hypothetical protein
MNALVAELKKFSKENKITLKDISESEWSDNETLEIYKDSAISAMTRLDLEVCVFTISTKARLSM